MTKIKLNPGTGSPPSSSDPVVATNICDVLISKGGALSQLLLFNEKLITDLSSSAYSSSIYQVIFVEVTVVPFKS